jgi:bifunctional enzyme CysN/CysC
VDDGKSTLIGRLLHDTQAIYEDQLAAVARDSARFGTTGAGALDLALLTDGLRAEREQGITIDVAYRYFSTERRTFIIADTPGHEQYTRNMATGASRCRLAILLVDARRGLLPQTRRHAFIVSLLGIRHVVVAVNKMDLVGYAREAFERVTRDYTAFAARLPGADVAFIPLSALHGDNVVTKSVAMPWYLGPPLLTHLETVPLAEDADGVGLRFPVQYVIRPHPDFRGFAGTIAAGRLRRGGEVVALPSGRRSHVKSIVTYDGEREEAAAPMAVTVTLEDEIDVSRGDMLADPSDPPSVANRVEAMIVWMGDKPLTPGRSYWIKHTTRTVSGRVGELRYGVDVNTLDKRPAIQLAMNEVGHVALTLDQPIAYDPYASQPTTGALIVIDRLTNNSVGAGMILADLDRRPGDEGWGSLALPGPRERPASGVSVAEREARLGQKGATVLLFGPDTPGRRALAHALERRLFDAGLAVMVLNGPDLRRGLSRDLDFTGDDHSESLRRAAEVARILYDAGLLCICAFVAPWDAGRETARQIVGPDRFLSVALSPPRATPPRADLTLTADAMPLDQSVALIVDRLRQRRTID